MMEMLKQWYGPNNPELKKRLANQDTLNKLWDTAVDAEHMLLVTLDFDLNIDLLVSTIARAVHKIDALEPLRENKKIQQFYINICNDAMLKDSTIVLQYRAADIALSIINFYFEFSKRVEKPGLVDGKQWFESQGLSVDLYNEIYNRFVTKLYVKADSKEAHGSKEASNTQVVDSSRESQTLTENNFSMMSMEFSQSPSKRARMIVDDNERPPETFFETSQVMSTQHSVDGAGTEMEVGQPVDDDSELEEGEIR